MPLFASDSSKIDMKIKLYVTLVKEPPRKPKIIKAK